VESPYSLTGLLEQPELPQPVPPRAMRQAMQDAAPPATLPPLPSIPDADLLTPGSGECPTGDIATSAMSGIGLMLLPFDLMHSRDPRSVGLPLPEGEGVRARRVAILCIKLSGNSISVALSVPLDRTPRRDWNETSPA
jgi:hypothetical protein